MKFKYYEHDNAKKFFKKHRRDSELLLRINKKYVDIINNPFKSEFSQLNSKYCSKCQRAVVGDYRIIFHVSRSKKIVEIIDIIPRREDYRKF